MKTIRRNLLLMAMVSATSATALASDIFDAVKAGDFGMRVKALTEAGGARLIAAQS